MSGCAMNLPRIALLSLLLSLGPVLAGCDKTPPAEPPLAGSSIGGPFTLIDQQGKTVRASDFAGKYRIVYFGYTYCPDVCPVDMQNIGGGMAKLRPTDPDLARKVAVIFISLDPERDTPDVVGKFVSAFGPDIIGLTGSAKAIDAAAKEYKVFYKKAQPEGASGYLINHSNAAYLMGPQGEPIALLSADESPQAVADELRKWVQ
ncbi:SCO family protein [Stakelama pacifica]|nr:SCO family protein [Stakelama pacifica]